jgi:hypothetical protein
VKILLYLKAKRQFFGQHYRQTAASYHFFHFRKFIWSALPEKAVLGEKQNQHKQGGKLLAESTVLYS